MTTYTDFWGAGGGKPKVTEFTANGTFTPTAAGWALVEGIGGGGSGSFHAAASGGVGGDAGEYRCEWVYLTGSALAVTIGTGGAAVSSTGNAAGNSGTATTLGGVFSAAGGAGGATAIGANTGGGGNGAGGQGGFATDATNTISARGGPGHRGRGGGGGGAGSYGPLHCRATDGGGNGLVINAVGTATSGAANTGGGGGGIAGTGGALHTSGAGGSGWLRIVEFTS